MPETYLRSASVPASPSRNFTSTSPGTTASTEVELSAGGISCGWLAGVDGGSGHAARAARGDTPQGGLGKRDIDSPRTTRWRCERDGHAEVGPAMGRAFGIVSPA